MRGLKRVTVAKGVAIDESGEAHRVEDQGWTKDQKPVYKALGKAFPWDAQDIQSTDLQAAWLLTEGE